MARTVGIKLTENEERNERYEQVLGGLYKTIRQVATELGRNREETPHAQKEIVLPNQKLQGANGNAKGEVQKNIDTLIQKYTESAKKHDTKVEENLTTKPYLGGN